MSPSSGARCAGPDPLDPIQGAAPAAASAVRTGGDAPVSSRPAHRLLAVLDDTSAARALLDISCTLAGLMRRELQLVYVESAAALAAAALPTTQVLAQATARWTPLAAPDVERAWQADAGRLRALAAQATLPRAVTWSLQVTRGTLYDTALALQTQSDLLLVGGSAAVLGEMTRPGHHPAARPAPGDAQRSAWRRVVALDDGSAAGRQAVTIARQLCSALGARLEVQRFDPAQGGLPRLLRADLVVMPGPWAVPRIPADPSRTPTLLVSRLAPSGG